MPRIPYLADGDIKLSDEFWQAAKGIRPDLRLLNLDRILCYSEPVIKGWQALFIQLRQNLHLSGKLRELIILRIAIVNKAPYEWDQHAHIALKEGATEAELEALKSSWQDSPLFNEEEKAVLAYADAITISIQVPDDIYTKLMQYFNNQQIVDITALVSGYNMVSRFLEALEITVEGE